MQHVHRYSYRLSSRRVWKGRGPDDTNLQSPVAMRNSMSLTLNGTENELSLRGFGSCEPYTAVPASSSSASCQRPSLPLTRLTSRHPEPTLLVMQFVACCNWAASGTGASAASSATVAVTSPDAGILNRRRPMLVWFLVGWLDKEESRSGNSPPGMSHV